MNNFCGSPDPERSYCFKVPNSYRYYEYNGYEDGVMYHDEDNIDVGNTIKMSKKCDSNWRPAGSYWDDYRPPGQTFCEHFIEYHFFSYDCSRLDPKRDYNYGELLTHAYYTPDGYTTVLNCPQCGCTDGTYDVENLFAMYTGEMTTTTTTPAATYSTIG